MAAHTEAVAPQLLLVLLLLLVLAQLATDKLVLFYFAVTLQGVFIAICVVKLLAMAGEWCTRHTLVYVYTVAPAASLYANTVALQAYHAVARHYAAERSLLHVL
jgi:hypothetical protein